MSDTIKACSFTGYRPDKFDFRFCEASPEYRDFENKLVEAVFEVSDEGYTDFFCGMAHGFDIVAGEAVELLKKARPGKARLIAVIPFEKQANAWTEEWKKRYSDLLSLADRVVYISREYSKDCYHRRNRYMVDNSDTVITFFDGKSGGTAATLRYAKTKQKRIINIAEIEDEQIYFSPYIICDDEDI